MTAERTYARKTHYSDPVAAARVYDGAAISLFGESARLNLPEVA